MASAPSSGPAIDLEKGVRDDDRALTEDQREKESTRPRLPSKSTNDHYFTADDLRTINKVLSTRSAKGGPVSPALNNDELQRLGRALSSKNRRSSKRRSEKGGGEDEDDDDGIDVQEVLGRIFQRDTSTTQKSLGVAFKNLIVEGEGFGATESVNIGDVARNFWPPNMVKQIRTKKKTPTKRLINDFSGVVEPGEMILVLGRPGSGCSTFLKTIAGYTNGYKSLEGELSYGGISLEEMQKKYRAEVTFNAEVDQHFATLSVQRTLDFAIHCRTPAGAERLEGESRADYRRTFRDVLATIFGLDRVLGTKIGNDMIRGVSGGEKKRVSIAETLTTRASVQAWDSATRGLDSSTALEYVKALRAMTNMTDAACLVALYQVSDQLTQLFDKIIVIESGREIYFGPVDEAQPYFEGLGFARPERQPLADYLSSVADIHARTVRDGYEKRIPRSAEDLQNAFRDTETWKANLQEVEEYLDRVQKDKPAESFRNAMASERGQKKDKKKAPSNYNLSFPAQTLALAKRQYMIQLGDPLSLGARYVSAIFQAIIVGSLFYNIPETTNGAFLRGGVAFFALLFNALLAMSEMTTAFESRPILSKQKSFAFYRPSAWALANILADLPVLAFQILLFSVVIYFMSNLQRTASQFFIFCLLLFITSLAITAFFRALAAITPSLNVATPLSGIGIQTIIVYSGYLIPYSSMAYWLRWLYWINPIAYGFEAILANEFTGLQQYCPDMTFIPFGPGYTSEQNRVCTLAGSQAGQRFVDGGAYIQAQFGYSRSRLWINLAAVIGLWVILIAIGVFGFEKRLGAASTGGEVVVYKRGMAPEAIQEALAKGQPVDDVEANRAGVQNEKSAAQTDEEEKRRQKELDQEAEKHLVKHESVFSWHHLNYDVGSGASGKRLLSDVSGYVKPGKLTALVGESGAGKTTLLTTLSQRQGSGIVTGDILVDGEGLSPAFARKIGFCEQADVHETSTTVREALLFSAILRQPTSVPREEKERYVDEVIALLELQDFQHAIIGAVGIGLNVEQRKRLTIGVELAAKPELLIFLDEPTSGLDAQSALSVVRFLRKLADSGQAILCTIHQPNAQLFDSFDALLLLGRGGKTMYFGETGDDSKTLIKYFESKGSRKCPEGYNPAEWMLEVVGAGASASSKRDWHSIWNDSEEKVNMLQELDRLVGERKKANRDSQHDTEDEKKTYAAPFLLQLRMVMSRQWTSYYRDVPYLMGKLMLHLFSALFNTFTFLQLGNARLAILELVLNSDIAQAVIDLQNRLFSTFLAVTILPPLVQQLQPRFLAARDLYETREGKARIYGWVPMIISNIACEIPWSLLFGSIYFPIWWFGVGLSRAGGPAAFGYLIWIVFELFLTSFGQAIAAMSPNAMFASLLVPFFFSFVVGFCGVLAPPMAIPTFWRVWMVPLTPFRWILGAFLAIELHDLPVNCGTQEFNQIIPPAGQTCGAYLQAFLGSGGPGFLANPDATDVCQYCQYAVGDQYLQTLEVQYTSRWAYFGYSTAYIFFNWAAVLAITYLFRIQGFSPFGFASSLFSRSKKSDQPDHPDRSPSSPDSERTAVDEPNERQDENPMRKEKEEETAGFAGNLSSTTAGKTA